MKAIATKKAYFNTSKANNVTTTTAHENHRNKEDILQYVQGQQCDHHNQCPCKALLRAPENPGIHNGGTSLYNQALGGLGGDLRVLDGREGLAFCLGGEVLLPAPPV